jgi:hypothetical protein
MRKKKKCLMTKIFQNTIGSLCSNCGILICLALIFIYQVEARQDFIWMALGVAIYFIYGRKIAS